MAFRSNKGQIRVVEAMIACIILIGGVSFSVYMSNVYTVMEVGEIEKVATSISNVLDNVDLVEKVISNQTSWEFELKGLIESLLPPDTFYKFSIQSAVTGTVFGEITNLALWNISSNVDFYSVEHVTTISLPLGRKGYIPLDVMLVMDVSGTMGNRLPGDTRQKIDGAKEAANALVTILALISFVFIFIF